MAEESSNGHRDEWFEDLDALVPSRAGRVKLLGQAYDAGHFIDLSNADAVKLVWLDREIDRGRETVKAATTLEEQQAQFVAVVQLEAEQIRLLCPTIPAGVICGLSIRVRGALRARVTTVAEAPSSANPPRPDADDPGSSDRSPASGVSTGTPTTT